jgi:type IV pilus assembly protein PilV
MSTPHSQKKHQGFTLIEVLVSLLIMTLGIVGVLKMQTQSLKSNQRAHFRTQADLLSRDLLARMQANKTEAQKGAYVASSKQTNPPDCQTTECNAEQLVKWDLHQWYEQIEKQLPAGSATVEKFSGDNRYLISIRWDDYRNSQTLDTQSCGNESGKVLCWGTVVQL